MYKISDSLFDVWFPTCHFYPSKFDIMRPPSFRKFLQTAEECCNRNFAKPSANWEVSSNQILTGNIHESSCSFICLKLVIYYLTYGFRPVISTRQNVISRGLSIFGSFCRPLRNVVAETFADHFENWEVSSNRILTGRPCGSFINVKLVIHYLIYTVSDFSGLPVNI